MLGAFIEFRSLDEVGDKTLKLMSSHVIPNVGDTITLFDDGVVYTVVSRHFDYINNKVIVRVTDGDIHDFR